MEDAIRKRMARQDSLDLLEDKACEITTAYAMFMNHAQDFMLPMPSNTTYLTFVDCRCIVHRLRIHSAQN
jgi:hypothetical protein